MGYMSPVPCCSDVNTTLLQDNEDSVGLDYRKYNIPRRPKNTLGPSTSLDDEGSDSCNDGETTRRATRL
jgi:hypothetical protein